MIPAFCRALRGDCLAGPQADSFAETAGSRLPRPPEPFWFVLALGGGMMLTAVTSHMSANIAAIPLLWLPPLALYLLTFILAFQGAWLPIRQSMLRLGADSGGIDGLRAAGYSNPAGLLP